MSPHSRTITLYVVHRHSPTVKRTSGYTIITYEKLNGDG